MDDVKNQPLIGASIYCTSLNKNAVSDEKGNFILSGLPATKLSIAFSYTGYATTVKEFDLSKGDIVDITIKLNYDGLSLNEIVVTGTTGGKTKLASSVSISSLKFDDANKAAPRTTAEIFRSIPGIKAEASGGDGNTNITVRGIPISSGGSKYLQLQEDGLPLLQFGDIAFATADIFLRADQTLSRIEAIRGGSASTLASNSPAGIINFISKTGNTEGGLVAITAGLDFNNTRTDFNFGTSIGEGLTMNVGGFYRLGEGPRTAGFTANNGGQLKLNLTKQFTKGYVRLYAKFLNDRAAAYMPMPIQVTGTNSNPSYSSLPTFDAKHGALQSNYLLQNYGLGVNAERRRSDVQDGMHPITNSVGAEVNFDLGEGWRLENRTRVAANSGRFVAPFPASVDTRSNILNTIATAKSWNLTGATLRYAKDNTIYNGSNAMIIHMFDTELNNFNNFVNDLKIKKKFKGADLTFGYFRSFQNINMSWLWNSYLTDVSGNGSRPLNIVSSTNQLLTQNGLFGYGVPVWGNCCTRSYDTKYDISAPYAAVSIEASEKFNIEASLRWDMGTVNGNYAGTAQSTIDVNNDGILQPTETSVSSINHAAASAVNYKYNYASYSIGANYKLTSSSALFTRISNGYAAKADRILFTPNVFANGDAIGVTDQLTQIELGYKNSFKKGGLFVTAFYGNVKEAGGYEATTQKVIENNYKSLGLEIEAVYTPSTNFDIRGSITYTNAEITDGANKGNKPRRQSPFIYNLVPTYTKNKIALGVSIIGTGASFAQDDNKLKFNGYAILNPFINYRFTKSFTASLNANNVLNVLGITESEEGSIVENQTNIIRARSIMGRTVSATVTFNF
ncbi:MAG: TonB-dependent receptor [Chitinophagaceae bacterium]|nr:TonB-dependent receptor [Chitinophagaceae bacterium]